MSDRKDAYQHDARLTGVQGQESQDPSKEHRETAYGNAEERNELDPGERNRDAQPRRTTHDDTRTTRKDGA